MSYQLIQSMMDKHHYPEIDVVVHDTFIARHKEVILFFTENPARFPESNDVAMILPEINKAFDQRFSIGVVSQPAQRKLQSLYNFGEWPALVFLRHGEFLGTICRVQDWSDYLQKIETLLAKASTRIPGLGIPIQVSPATPVNQGTSLQNDSNTTGN